MISKWPLANEMLILQLNTIIINSLPSPLIARSFEKRAPASVRISTRGYFFLVNLFYSISLVRTFRRHLLAACLGLWGCWSLRLRKIAKTMSSKITYNFIGDKQGCTIVHEIFNFRSVCQANVCTIQFDPYFQNKTASPVEVYLESKIIISALLTVCDSYFFFF